MSEDAIRVEARKLFRQLRERLGRDRWAVLFPEDHTEWSDEDLSDSDGADTASLRTPEGSDVERSVSPQVPAVGKDLAALYLQEQGEVAMSD